MKYVDSLIRLIQEPNLLLCLKASSRQMLFNQYCIKTDCQLCPLNRLSNIAESPWFDQFMETPSNG